MAKGDEIGCRTQLIGFGTLRVQEYLHQEISGECDEESLNDDFE